MPSQGAIINIAGSTPVDDPEYRYKMPSVFGKIEGRGNGIKTVIPNISEVALALHREPGEVNKFFGTELGAQTTYNADTDRAVVNGAHTDQVLQRPSRSTSTSSSSVLSAASPRPITRSKAAVFITSAWRAGTRRWST